MDTTTMRETLAQFEVVQELLYKAEDELNMNSGDIRRARGYLIAARGVSDSQITILRDTLEVLGP